MAVAWALGPLLHSFRLQLFIFVDSLKDLIKKNRSWAYLASKTRFLKPKTKC